MAGEASYSEESELDRLTGIVERGRGYASERFTDCPEVRRKLVDAEVIAQDGLDDDIRVDPPRKPDGGYQILFDPAGVARLASDHKYPVWVVSAKIEALIVAAPSKCQASESEVKDLAAHRERIYRPRSSSTGPITP